MPSFVPPSIPGAAGYPLGLTGATVATRYVGGTATTSPASGTFAVGDYVVTADGKMFVCTVAGSPGTWVQVGAFTGGTTRYLSKPAGNITRAATTVGAFSTAWQITGVVVGAAQNVKLSMHASTHHTTSGADILMAFFRGETQLAAASFTNTTTVNLPFPFEWIDEAPGAGTYTYEIRAAMFTSGTLTVYQTNITTDVDGGSSIFIAEVYTP